MKNKVIKVIAVLTALVTLFSFAACGEKKDETTTTAKSNDTVQTDVAENEGEEATEEAEGEEDTEAAEGEEDTEAVEGEEDTEAVEGEEDTEAAEGEEDTEAVVENGTTEKAEDDTTKKTSNENKTTKKDSSEKKTTTKKNATEKTTKKDTTNKTTTKKETTKKNNTEKTTKKETTTKKKSFSKAEIIDMATKAINKAKDNSPGYRKVKYQKMEGDRKAVPVIARVLFGIFEEESDKTVKKGKADVNNFGVDGYVITKVSDIDKVTCKEEKGQYVINYYFGKETNPEDKASKYGRTMDIMSRSEAMDMAGSLIKDLTMNYYDGKLTVKIDKATGNMSYLQMGATLDATVTLNSGKSFTAKKVVSRSTYTDFVW